MIRKCLQGLSAEHREIIDLVYYHEKSVEEVAEIVRIPEATVKDNVCSCAQEKTGRTLKVGGGRSRLAMNTMSKAQEPGDIRIAASMACGRNVQIGVTRLAWKRRSAGSGTCAPLRTGARRASAKPFISMRRWARRLPAQPQKLFAAIDAEPRVARKSPGLGARFVEFFSAPVAARAGVGGNGCGCARGDPVRPAGGPVSRLYRRPIPDDQ